jgi:hypothetical protein
MGYEYDAGDNASAARHQLCSDQYGIEDLSPSPPRTNRHCSHKQQPNTGDLNLRLRRAYFARREARGVPMPVRLNLALARRVSRACFTEPKFRKAQRNR